ncbi:hypothetical protein TNCV_3345191 [Trichonephila clavipes]|nr:hypothetical protein TNCV_3345191 [Trichonephila clavipes]
MLDSVGSGGFFNDSGGKISSFVILNATENIMLQYQGEDPTGKPATRYLQHLPYSSLFGDTEERYHQLIDRSGLTPATRLQ